MQLNSLYDTNHNTCWHKNGNAVGIDTELNWTELKVSNKLPTSFAYSNSM